MKKGLSLCVDLYNLDYNKQYISGCAKLEAHILYVVVESIDLGCFSIPLHGIEAEHNAAILIRSIQAARVQKWAFQFYILLESWKNGYIECFLI